MSNKIGNLRATAFWYVYDVVMCIIRLKSAYNRDILSIQTIMPIRSVKNNEVKIIRVAVLRGTKRPYHLADKGLKDEISKPELVLQLIERKGEASRKDVETLLSCSKFPAITILNQLLREQKIVKCGAARAITYKLTK